MKRGIKSLALFLALVEPASTYADPIDVVTKLLCFMLLVAPGIVFAMIVIASIVMVMGASSPPRRDYARKLFVNAIIGGVLIIALVQAAKIVNVGGRTIDVDMASCLAMAGGP